MSPPRFLADEMLGRLARYLRFVGCDTVYLRGVGDEEIVALARAEGRVVITRDRALARRAAGALWIGSPGIREQWAAVRAARPDVPPTVRFDRCTVCNGALAPYRLGTAPDREAGVPAHRVEEGLELWACLVCGHLFWEGSHTAHIRARLAAWSEEPRA